jgi:hypothetical protein
LGHGDGEKEAPVLGMGLASIAQSRRRPTLVGLAPKTSVAYGLRPTAPLKASYISAKSNHKTYGVIFAADNAILLYP